MKRISIAITAAAIVTLGQMPSDAAACMHNVDPSTVSAVGYSTFDGGNYSRVEYLAGKVLAKKKMVKLFFGFNTVNSRAGIKIIDLRRNKKVAKELTDLRGNIAGIHRRGMRSGMKSLGARTRIVGDKAITVAVYKKKDGAPAALLQKISKKYGFAFDPSHGMEAKVQQAFDLGLDLIVVSMKKAKGAKAPPTAIALKITPKKVSYGMNYSDYFRQITTIKALELDMSSVGRWGFRIGGISFVAANQTLLKTEGAMVGTSTSRGFGVTFSKVLKLTEAGAHRLKGSISVKYVPESYVDPLSPILMYR